jgi:hypothetical protein
VKYTFAALLMLLARAFLLIANLFSYCGRHTSASTDNVPKPVWVAWDAEDSPGIFHVHHSCIRSFGKGISKGATQTDASAVIENASRPYSSGADAKWPNRPRQRKPDPNMRYVCTSADAPRSRRVSAEKDVGPTRQWQEADIISASDHSPRKKSK